MTAKSRANLKAVFETGDRPQGSDFEDLIDSFVAITETTAHSLAGNLTVPGLGANTVSAGTVYSDNAFGQGLNTHKNPFANAYADVTAITSIEATGAWVLVSAALTAPDVAGFSVSGHDVIYTGSVTARMQVQAQIDAKLSAHQNAWASLFVNGSIVSASITKKRAATAANAVHTFGVSFITTVKPNEIINARMQTPEGPIASPLVLGVKYVITPAYWG